MLLTSQYQRNEDDNVTISFGLQGNKRSFADAFSTGGVSKTSVTPSAKRAAFTAHSDVKPGKKGLKESAKKNR